VNCAQLRIGGRVGALARAPWLSNLVGDTATVAAVEQFNGS
jgi:hypothetical protein